VQQEQPIRTFIAIEPGDDMQRALTQAQAVLRRLLPFSTLRWTAPEGIHLTLKFLGDTPLAQVGVIQAALAGVAARHARFCLTATQLGVFPNATRPAVLWVGLQGDTAPLQRLRDDVERVIAPLGFPTERRPFHPHLTLARIKMPSAAEARALQDVLRQDPVGRLGKIDVSDISLMRSDLSPRGARYTRLACLELSA
jgi:2'-5' RNA ligase